MFVFFLFVFTAWDGGWRYYWSLSAADRGTLMHALELNQFFSVLLHTYIIHEHALFELWKLYYTHLFMFSVSRSVLCLLLLVYWAEVSALRVSPNCAIVYFGKYLSPYFTGKDLATKQFNTEMHCLLMLAQQCSTFPIIHSMVKVCGV